MNRKTAVGLFFLFLGAVSIVYDIRLTGAVIGGGFFSGIGTIGILSFILGGVMLVMGSNKYETRARQLYNSGGFYENPNDLTRLARKMGYVLETGHKEGTKVLHQGMPITVIPNHPRIKAKGTGRSILEALLNRESSLRRSS
jgi:hypothetical protein